MISFCSVTSRVFQLLKPYTNICDLYLYILLCLIALEYDHTNQISNFFFYLWCKNALYKKSCHFKKRRPENSKYSTFILASFHDSWYTKCICTKLKMFIFCNICLFKDGSPKLFMQLFLDTILYLYNKDNICNMKEKSWGLESVDMVLSQHYN